MLVRGEQLCPSLLLSPIQILAGFNFVYDLEMWSASAKTAE